MKIEIPLENADIRKSVRNRLVRQIVLCSLWTVAVSVFMVAYAYGYFAEAVSPGTAIGIWILLCLIPFIKCKCWLWVTDRSFEGTVISCRQTAYMQVKRPTRPEKVWIYTQNIRIRPDGGEEKTVKLSWDVDKEDVPYYYEGERVRHYRGTKFMQVISDDPKVPRICVLCGTANLSNETGCMICGSSLIDHTK